MLLQGSVSRFDKLGLDEAETEGLLYRCTHFFSTFLFLNVFVGCGDSTHRCRDSGTGEQTSKGRRIADPYKQSFPQFSCSLQRRASLTCYNHRMNRGQELLFASSRQYPGSSFFILFRLFDEPVIARKPVGVGVVRAGRKVHTVVVARAGEHRKCRWVVGLCEQGDVHRLCERRCAVVGDAGRISQSRSRQLL